MVQLYAVYKEKGKGMKYRELTQPQPFRGFETHPYHVTLEKLKEDTLYELAITNLEIHLAYLVFR